ncbi:ESX secretion-associated protein EspG [Amycolatopsis alkalitolerans]|uniref:ESX secretion-associated protein EspG n=1 Tax=Amycolatopsis alkalitolerans TaxID=2547244 RepID=A0A5C4M459_9PSEU|nr:ESX secretion-associated protein EspG [Amycolatopsis alkalitolerans]TNC26089.1 ESX secretion-associated protein EspG [Amycolatopsis alkalitolerans]
MSAPRGSLVLSTTEFDVLWETERLPPPHPALRVLSPGRTHGERRALVADAWLSLGERRLARGTRASGELVDQLNLLAHPKVSIDIWVWADREIKGLAVSTGSQALLAVIDRDEVWLIPARDTSLPESAVSVAGELHAGVGHSVSVPHRIVRAADADAKGEPKALVTALEDRGVALAQAQELAGMMVGMAARGQFGVERLRRDGGMRRGDRVVAFHDTDAGRYLVQLGAGADGDWVTVAPADNQLLAARIWELLEEV